MFDKKDGQGWFFKGQAENAKFKKYAKIDSVSFNCAQDYPLGLHLIFDLEDGGSVNWSFYEIQDMRGFMEQLGVEYIDSLVGKIVETWWKEDLPWGNSILGLTINKNLV